MRHIPLESAEELRAMLADAGVSGMPDPGPDQESLQAVLAFALHLAERHKDLAFDAFSWEDPRFDVHDAKVDVELVVARLEGKSAADVADALRGALERRHKRRVMVALDARASGITEYELVHHIYGEVTLFSYPSRPPPSQDPRIEHARERGWTRTLKEHNLLPGRGLVVMDDHQGLFLTEPHLDELSGVFVLLPTNHITFMLNPFVQDAVNDAELEHWLAWGGGTKASEWRVVLDVAKEREPEDE